MFSELIEVIAKFLELSDVAADATGNDTWDIAWFRNSEEWVILSDFAKQSLATFAERGRLSEEQEADMSQQKPIGLSSFLPSPNTPKTKNPARRRGFSIPILRRRFRLRLHPLVP